MVTAEPPTEVGRELSRALLDVVDAFTEPEFAVVVEVPTRRDPGNLAVAGSLYVKTDPHKHDSFDDWMGWATANFATC